MRASKYGDEIRLDDCYLHKDAIKEVAGRRWDSNLKAWFIPHSENNMGLIKMLGAELVGDLNAPQGTLADEADIEPIRRMPIKAKPYRHQVAAFNFAIGILSQGTATGGKVDDG